MRTQRFIIYLIAQVLVIVAVTVIFKLNHEVKWAATQAGSLFVLLPLGLLFNEYQITGVQKRLWFAACLQFWLLFALPILSLRLLNWEMDFKDIQLLGITGPVLHTWSSKSYMVMLAFTLREAILTWIQAKKDKNKKPG